MNIFQEILMIWDWFRNDINIRDRKGNVIIAVDNDNEIISTAKNWLCANDNINGYSSQ